MNRFIRLALGLVLVGSVVALVAAGVVVRTRDHGGLWSAMGEDGPVADVLRPPAPDPAPAADAEGRTTTVKLRRGDSLVRALSREGVQAQVGADVASALRASGAQLRRLKPDDTVAITFDLHGEPVRVEYEASPWLGFAAIAHDDGGWRVERVETAPAVRTVVVGGEVKRSLWEAVEEAGESAPLVQELVEIFSSDFDFTADTRSGDRFRLLVEKRYAEDTFVDYGRVLGAQYVSDGAVLTGIAFEPAGATRPAFFDPEGRALHKTFLKSPLEFTRITSGFTYARPHPILGGTRPHLAIDYAAPVGTPVRAVADGTVASAGWAGGTGISVRLRHRAGYETMYNHLSRAAVRSGSRVRQRQVIGYVGSTGLSTGPHLDYRVSKNGVFVNPLHEKFVPGPPIAGADRARFHEHARQVMRRLSRGD